MSLSMDSLCAVHATIAVPVFVLPHKRNYSQAMLANAAMLADMVCDHCPQAHRCKLKILAKKSDI